MNLGPQEKGMDPAFAEILGLIVSRNPVSSSEGKLYSLLQVPTHDCSKAHLQWTIIISIKHRPSDIWHGIVHHRPVGSVHSPVYRGLAEIL